MNLHTSSIGLDVSGTQVVVTVHDGYHDKCDIYQRAFAAESFTADKVSRFLADLALVIPRVEEIRAVCCAPPNNVVAFPSRDVPLPPASRD